MNVSAWSIRNPVPAILLFALLTAAGLLAFHAAKVQNFPDVDLPMVTVFASLPGTAPAQMETEVARRLENAMATMKGLRHLHTTVQDGTATVGTVSSAAELAAIEIPLASSPEARVVRLDQVATVTDTLAERRSGAFLDGWLVVGFAILVVALFLRDARATFVSAVALPLSIIPTFLLMQWMGFTLNLITLLSLSLVVGILVDDAIVEIENIMRHLAQGKAPLVAGREAADQIGLAVIATTFTPIAVFLPTAFMKGLAGRFFVQFGWTASIAVFFSLVVARLLTPMMAAYLLKPPSRPPSEPFWMPAYLKTARWAFTHKGATLAVTAVFCIASGSPLFTGAIKGAFMPPEDTSLARVAIELPPGSTYAQTRVIAETVRVATLGDYDPFLPKLNLSQRQVPIVVRLPDDAARDLDLLAQLTVPGARGPVPLRDVAQVGIASGPARILRLDRLRNVNFDIELNGLALGDVQQRAAALPSLTQLPPGVRKSDIGQAETSGELGHSVLLAMGTGVACICVVLVLLFHAWVQPVTILAALLLSAPGAVPALFATGTDLSMPAMIGMIMLMGIATKNSILLVEHAIVAQRDHGLPRLDALLDACRKRARPIVMTTLAMGAGTLPIALGFGAERVRANRLTARMPS